MRKGLIVNLKRFKLFDYVTLNKIFILLSVFFISGITIGSVLYSKSTNLMQLSKSLFENYIEIHNKHWLSVFGSTFFKCFIVLVLYFLSGTSMLGVATVPFLVLWQGIIFGSISSFLYSGYALKGIAFNAIILVLPSIIFTLCCFSAARESINFSLLFARLTLPKSKPANIYTDFRKYCGKFLIIVCISLLSVLVDLFLNLLFLHFFEF